MKKLLVLLLGLSLLLGCGGKPRNMNDEAYTVGKRALEITDRYLDGDATASEARSMIDDLQEHLEDMPESDIDEISRSTMSSSLIILSGELIIGDDVDIIKSRDSLADKLGEKAR